MSDKNNVNEDWKSKFNDLVSTCQSELKKTTQIGMKMLSASQSNTNLKETYEHLGKCLIKMVKNSTITIQDEEVLGLIEKVEKLEERLQSYEKDVQDIKKGN